MKQAHRSTNRDRGFTLLELMIVILLIGVLLSFAVPNYYRSMVRARETILRQNLYTLRQTIQEFTLDKKRAPFSLDELVSEEYLHSLPKDITGSPVTWREETCDLLFSPEQSEVGLCDVRSGSDEISSEGTSYSEW